MRLYDILTAIVNKLGQTGDGYVIFPGGLRACWGVAANLKNGDTVTLPISFTDGVVVPAPRHNTQSTLRHIFTGARLQNTDQFTIFAWDTVTNAASAYSNLSIFFIAIGK